MNMSPFRLHAITFRYIKYIYIQPSQNRIVPLITDVPNTGCHIFTGFRVVQTGWLQKYKFKSGNYFTGTVVFQCKCIGFMTPRTSNTWLEVIHLGSTCKYVVHIEMKTPL